VASELTAAPAASIRRSRWRAILESTRLHIRDDRVNVAAGSLAYRWFLSLFPIIIALLGVSALAHIPHHVITTTMNGVGKALPAGASGVLTQAISQAQRRPPGAFTATLVAGLVAIWSATSGMAMLQEALDMAYEVPTDRKFLGKRLVALPLIAAATLLGGAASALIVFGPQIGSAIKSSVPVAGGLFSDVWTAVRWLGALVLMGLLFSVFYFLGPSRSIRRWQWVSPGAVVATGLWALASLAFSFYTSRFGSYGKTYGAFAGVAILILWLYLTGLAVLVGAEINAAVARLNGSGPAQTSRAGVTAGQNAGADADRKER
jgi:membrane protein